jgi:C4-dicarboxylate transporter DctM subunit
LLAVSVIVIAFGMVLEGPPAAVGIGLFRPPIGVGLLMTLRFADISVDQHLRAYWPYLLALFTGLLILILAPEISLSLPRRAGMVR